MDRMDWIFYSSATIVVDDIVVLICNNLVVAKITVLMIINSLWNSGRNLFRNSKSGIADSVVC